VVRPDQADVARSEYVGGRPSDPIEPDPGHGQESSRADSPDEEEAMKRSAERATITGEAILIGLQGAMAKAHEEKVQIVAAVVDTSGMLVGFVASDGAARISHTVARDKAFTSAMTGMPTIEWKAYVDSIPAHEREIIAKHEGYIGADGGFPILDGDRVIGGIGVSGANQEIDAACARAGLEAIDAAD
jgi:uncharacterized protein GlcG (DUF336 family)